MPKNENGDVVCINHPEEILTNKTFVSFNQLLYSPSIGKLQPVVNQTFPAKIRFCQACGYMEMYTIRPEEDFPGHTHDVENT